MTELCQRATKAAIRESIAAEEDRKKLPIFSVKQRLVNEIQQNQSLILLGETGSGTFKTFK